MARLSIILLFAVVSQLCLAQRVAEQPKKSGGGGGKNILVYMAASSYSMRISVWPLVIGMIEKGHHVTFVSSQQPKNPDPRVHDFPPKRIEHWFESIEEDIDFLVRRNSGDNRLAWYQLPGDFGIPSCEELYADKEAVEWIRKSKYDLVVVDSINECGYGLAHYFKAKTVLFSAFTVAPWFYQSYGMVEESSWQADMSQYFPAFGPTLLSRAVATLNPIVWKIIREYWYFPKLEEIAKKGLAQVGFTEDIPSFRELEKNTSLVFVTNHYASEYARSFPPNVIPIGGMALGGKKKPVPKEFEDFINKGKQGFILISFGSVFDVSRMKPEDRDIIVKALVQFPHIQFIWKATGGVGVEMPKNFMISDWVPQQDLFAHPKIKAFITHGGMGSVTEAIHYGVPMIGFPLLYDQDHNANFIEPKGLGFRLEISTLTTEEFKNAIHSITTDPKYMENAKKVSVLFNDRPMTPLDTALWWIEFVLRHDTAEITEFMHSRIKHQSWWVRRNLDIWLLAGIFAGLLVFIPSYILCKLLRRVVGGGGGSQKKSKQH